MTIKVISQTTAQRREETKELFRSIQPLLDEGYSYSSALIKVGRVGYSPALIHRAWFRELIEYGGTQGYDYNDYVGKGFKK